MSSVSSSRVDLVRSCAVFVAVAEEGHFGAAADRLGMSQPPVSQGLRRLEAFLGTRLIDRTRDGAVVTPAGRRLLPLARTLVRDAIHLETTAQELSAHGAAFMLGVAATVPVPAATAAVVSIRPHVGTVRLARATGPDIVEMVGRGELDAGVIEDPLPMSDLVRGVTHRLRRRLSVPADVEAEGGSRLPWKEIRGLELAMPDRSTGPAAWDQLVDLVHDSGSDPGAVEYSSVAEALMAVAAGSAVCVVDAAQPEVDGVALLDLPERFDQRLRVVVHPDRQRTADDGDIRSLVDKGLTRYCRELASVARGPR